MLRVPPIFSNIAAWVRDAAQAINQLQNKAVLKDGTVLYTAPTISNPPTQAEVQAIADALEDISARLEG